jgi:HSP20 family protein
MYYLTRRTLLPWGAVVRQAPLTAYPTFPLDIRRTEDAYVIEASVPGFAPDQVQVTVDQNWLVIHADRDQASETTEGGWLRRERRSASIHRRLALPEEVDVDRISASVTNGELAITVPRSPRIEPRRVPVLPAAAAEAAPADTATA